MTQADAYLRPNVAVEPLFNRWYATSQLVSPATCAMFVSNAHIRMMRSFIAAPTTHQAALRDPQMRGGPFLAYGPERVGEVRALLERTLADAPALLEFAAGVRTLEALLAAEATGAPLEALYARMPAALRGYVELTYEQNDRPSFRFFERLLYRSRFFRADLQSLSLAPLAGEERPFVLSTPRLGGDEALQLRVPFASPALDLLYRARISASELGPLGEALGVAGADTARFARLFTAQRPRHAAPYTGPGVRVRYMGHACVLVETREGTLLVDPLLSHDHGVGAPRFTLADLPPRIDHVLITHNHLDHVVLETLLELRHRVGTVVVPRSGGGTLLDPSLRLVFEHLGFPRVVELDALEVLETPAATVTAVPFLGEHGDLAIASKTAFHLQRQGRTVLLLADSNNLEPEVYHHVHDALGDVDLMLVGMECAGAPMSWGYGALFSRPVQRGLDNARRLNGSDATKVAGLVRQFGPKQVWVYAMGQEPWLGHITSVAYDERSRPITESDKLIAECRARGLEAERLIFRREVELAAR